MADGGAAEQICDLVLNAAPAKLEPPRPLMRDMPAATPFPVDALGSVLGPAALGINDRVRSPLAICGQSVLAAANLAVQAHADVELPIGRGQARPISCFFVTVAATGERKSASDHEAIAPVRRREAALRESYDADRQSYLNDQVAWEKARDNGVKAAKGDRAGIKKALDDHGPEPRSPLTPMLTCPEPTFEGLCKLFVDGQPSLGVFAAEGGQFIGGHGMSPDNKLRTAAGLSDLWDGSAIRRVRSGDGTTILPGRRLSVHLMAQPGVANMLFQDAVLADQGLLSRMLVTSPDTAAGTRLWREERPETDRALAAYRGRLLTILEMPPPLVAGKTNQLAPRNLVLSGAARRAWTGFSDHVERAIAPNGSLAPVAGLANKLAEHAARLAAVLTLVRDIDAAEIASEEMSAGIVLAQHYAAEALRLFGTNSVPPDLHLAQKTLAWLHVGWGNPLVSLPDLYQRGPTAIRDKAGAQRIARILEDHGYLQNLPQGADVEGVHRRDVWRIVG